MESIIILIHKALIYTKFLAVASGTLIIYDHVITFDQEVGVVHWGGELIDRHNQVALFWSGPRDASRILYLAVSYFPLRASTNTSLTVDMQIRYLGSIQTLWELNYFV